MRQRCTEEGSSPLRMPEKKKNEAESKEEDVCVKSQVRPSKCR